MGQGNIHRLRGGGELVCRVQTDLGVETPYILCAPVAAREAIGALIPKLHIPVLLQGAPHVIVMSQLVALPATELGPIVSDATSARDAIVGAIDLLVSGF